MTISAQKWQRCLALMGLLLVPAAAHAAEAPANTAHAPQVYVDLTQANNNTTSNNSMSNSGNGTSSANTTSPALPPSGLTADDAKNNSTDLSLMQQIRRSIVADSNLSTAAQNINIVARDGKVTLQGTVDSDNERRIILAKAATVAGAPNINNELTVTNTTNSTTTR